MFPGRIHEFKHSKVGYRERRFYMGLCSPSYQLTWSYEREN
jgi:hypothetical protein